MKSRNRNLMLWTGIAILVVSLMSGMGVVPVTSAADPTPENGHEEAHDGEHEAHIADQESADVIPPIDPVDIPQGGKLKVVATTATVGYIVSQIGGDAIELTTLMEPGQDSHAYQSVPRDVAVMAEADILFVNGAGLEEFMNNILDSLEGEAVIVSVSSGIELIAAHHQHEDDGGHGGEPVHEEGDDLHARSWDPHTWTSPANVMIWIDNIEYTLSTADPAHAATYATNAESYRRTLQDVDTWAVESVSQLPPEKRKIVTNHEAWNYFARHFGFEQIGAVIPAVTTSVDPTAQEFAELAQTFEDAGVNVVFVDYEVNPKLSEAMAGEIGARVVRIWHELSPAGEGADTYEDWLRFNINRFVENLK